MTRLLLYLAAAFCFLVALLLSLGVFAAGNGEAWQNGGLLAVALAFALGEWPAAGRRVP